MAQLSSVYLYVSVLFPESQGVYNYLSDDILIEPGDIVVVPVSGKGPKTAYVKDVCFYYEKNAPYPPRKTSSVMRLANEQEKKEFYSQKHYEIPYVARRDGLESFRHKRRVVENPTRSFSNDDARVLISKYQNLVDLGKSADQFIGQYESKIKDLIRRNDFNTFYSNQILQYFQNETELEDKSQIAQELIENIYRWQVSCGILEKCNKLRLQYEKSINEAIQDLSIATGSFKWMFSSRKDKTNATTAYEYLKNYINNNYQSEISSIPVLIEHAKNIDVSSAWHDFEADKSLYADSVKHIAKVSSLPGDHIPKCDELFRQYEKINSRYNGLQGIIEQYEKDIKDAAQYVRNEDTINLLKTVPVDEINRNHNGFRVNTLRNAGYISIADLAVTESYKIANIHNISYEAAQAIKEEANNIYYQTFSTSKIRLSLDNKSTGMTRLVSAIAKYRPFFADIRTLKLQRDYEFKGLDDYAKAIDETRGGVRWFFSEMSDREMRKDAYRSVIRFNESSWGMLASDLYGRMSSSVSSISVTDAWKDFEEHSVDYYTILEYLLPDLMSSDSTYGLPEDLAREIEEEVYFPDGFIGNLKKYQEWGVKYILHQKKALLGDEMGLGKTVQAICTMVSLKNIGANHFMVICPASVLVNWQKEIVKFSKLRPLTVHGRGKKYVLKNWLKKGGVAITTYETVGSLNIQDENIIDFLVVDEAHYIKNPDAKRTKNVRKLAAKSDRILLMTGTALENKVEEMVSLIDVVNPKLASEISKMSFMAAAPQFREKVAPVYFRRKREQVLNELPELTEEIQWCVLSNYEKDVYRHALQSNNYSNIRRVSWNVDDIEKSSKAQRLKELVDEATEEGRNIIVFSFYLDTIEKVKQTIGNKYYGLINGSVPAKKRDAIIEGFGKQKGKVLLAQIIAGGTGLNIQTASVVIFCEPQLKPSLETQAISRSYRLGQVNNVLVYRLLCSNTIDERITDLLAEKQAIFNEFADKSVAAEQGGSDAIDATEEQHHPDKEIDNKTFGKLIQEEIKRMNGEGEDDQQSHESFIEYEDDIGKDVTEELQEELQYSQKETVSGNQTPPSQNSKPNGRPVLQLGKNGNIIAEYPSVAEAVRAVGSNSKSIRDAAKGVQNTAGGYRWAYKDEYGGMTEVLSENINPHDQKAHDMTGGSQSSLEASRTSDNNPVNEPISGNLMQDLRRAGYIVIDNRKSSDIIWVLYDNKDQFEKIMNSYNCKYAYEARGAITTKGRKAWRIMGYKGE